MQKGNLLEPNFEGLETWKWNILTDRTQGVYQKNGVICLNIMLIPRFMFIKMSKMVHFVYFLLMKPKNWSHLEKVFKRI